VIPDHVTGKWARMVQWVAYPTRND